MRLSALATRPNKNWRRHYTCTHVFFELTAVCPVTRLPDFYKVTLSYEPDRLIIELKSLKLYLVSFRDVEILHEEITNKILDDFVKAINPRWASIVVEVNNRGGIVTMVSRKWDQKTGDVQQGVGQTN